MAEKNQQKTASSLELLKKQVDDMYNTTYYSSDNSEEMRSQATDKLDDAIRASTQGDEEFQNISNTSKLFMKLLKHDNVNTASTKLSQSFGKGDGNDITTMFQSPTVLASLMDAYSGTKSITELDKEFDLICKYMTKLQASLDIKRDAVLCSDTYSKKFLNVRAKGENPSSDKNTVIQNNIDSMIDKYDLHDKAESWYENTSKYGEEFVYCVPYKTAFKELLKRKDNTKQSIYESTIELKDVLPKGASGTANVGVNESGDFCINLKLDKSKVLAEAVKNNYYLRKSMGDSTLRGLSESYITETDEDFESHLSKDGKDSKVKFDKTVGEELEWEDDRTAASGLIDKNNNNRENNVRINGAILRTIHHDKIVPIYIEDTMFGAYYVRFNSINMPTTIGAENKASTNSMNSIFNTNRNSDSNEDEANSHDMLLRRLSAEISSKIDAAFINANADLKKEIYLMLKFNDTYNQLDESMDMNVVFIPADDIHHLKFKEDPITHRGISDLWDSLIPAKQWITLTLTSILGTTTRGFDRRVYYVKQSLDTNTAQSLLNVISTIKKGNFGIRQMESVNNILNIVGKYNDFVIPVGSSNDAPIQFDTMPGQQFETNDALLANLEESAVNSTGVPLEIVNSSAGMDFAVRYTMTNAKLLRNVLKRQLKMETFLSEVFTKIYKFEYDESIELEVTLPPPAFLSMTQGTQLLSSAVQYAENITEVEMAGEEDAAKNLFKKRIIRKLIPEYISDAEIEDIKNNIIIDNSINKSKKQDNGDY